MNILSFIPRLVVHRDEVNRIYFPDAHLFPTNHTTLIVDDLSSEDTDLNLAEFSDGNGHGNGSNREAGQAEEEGVKSKDSEAGGNQSYRAFVAHLAEEIPGAIMHAAADLPFTLAQIAVKTPVTIIRISDQVAGGIYSLPSRVQGIPLQVIQLSSDVVREAMQVPERMKQVAKDVAKDLVEIPHMAAHKWRELIFVLFLLVFLTLILASAIFFVPLPDVNAGPEANKVFLYGYLTYYQGLLLIPLIETCNFTFPEARFTVKSRILTLLSGLGVEKCFDALVVNVGHVFPIPFSLQVSGFVSYLLVVPTLWLTSKRRRDHNFADLFKLLSVYMGSLLLIGLWAVGIRRTEGRAVIQALVSTTYGPLRFVCKIMIAAPLTTRINPRRWIMLNLVVDILFTRVQISSFPFIDSCFTVIMLISTEIGTLLWRYYSGIDRLALWFNAISSEAADEGDPNQHRVHKEFGSSWRDLTKGCFNAPISHISQMQMEMRRSQGTVETETSSSSTSLESTDQNSSTRSSLDQMACQCSTLSTEDRVGTFQSSSLSSEEVLVSYQDEETGSKMEEAAPTDRLPDTIFRADSQESTGLHEELWEQRPLYHIIDSVGSTCISIIVRVSQQVGISLARSLPISNRLNEAFVADEMRWRRAQLYGWTFIVLMICLLGALGWAFFARLEQTNHAAAVKRKLTLSRVVSYITRDHFWFFFLWLAGTGAHVTSSMIQQFGTDFTLNFEWIGCPQQDLKWPHCIHNRS